MNSNFKNKYLGDKQFYKMIMTIALPIIIQNVMTNFVNLLDNVMVGQLGTDQMTGVAVVNQLFFVFNLAVFGGMSGAGIFSAQYFGQNNSKGVRNVFRMKTIIGIVLLIVSLTIFILYYEPLINMFLHEGGSSGNIEKTYDFAKTYLFIMLIGIPPFIITNCYGTTLKEAGQTMLPMIAGVAAVLVDLVFNYLLIFGSFGFPKLGVAGAAIATAMSRYVECLILTIYTHSHSYKFDFIKGVYRSMKVPVSLAKNVLTKGTPILINELLWSAGLTIQTQALSIRGLSTIGALNITNTINNVFNIVFVTIGTTISIIVGQLLGAGKTKEAKDTDRKLCVFAIMTSLFISLILVVFSPVFPRLYNTTDEIRNLAASFFLVYAIVTPFNSFSNAAYFTLRSGGKTLVTFLFDSCFIWVVNVPLSLLLVHYTSLPVVNIFLIVNLCETIKAFIGFALVKKGVWLNKIVD